MENYLKRKKRGFLLYYDYTALIEPQTDNLEKTSYKTLFQYNFISSYYVKIHIYRIQRTILQNSKAYVIRF